MNAHGDRTRARQPVGQLWGIVLAGGEGKRLAPLTRAVYGCDLPKQFAALGSQHTFLQETLDRIAPLVPPRRTVVVVSQVHAHLAQRQLSAYPGVRLVLQPTNAGTTSGVLLPLIHILAEDPKAIVVVFPCDHRFRRLAAFTSAVRQAVAAARHARGGVVLIGAAPDSAEADLGWIVPGRAAPGGRAGQTVRRFVEKPSQEATWTLLRQGGLWNTMLIAARGRALWQAALRHAPEVARALDRYAGALGTRQSEEVLGEVYLRLPRSDLSEDVLQATRGLRVIPMIDSGWSDCGTPERLFRSLDAVAAERLRRACRRGANSGLNGKGRARRARVVGPAGRTKCAVSPTW
jgi:mannose-1-phosphate guanylyltransferase